MFTCAPKKLDTFNSFRPSQTVTKYCTCHTILRVRLQAANQKSQRTVNAMQNEPRSLALQFLPPRSDRHKVLCLPHNSTRQPESSQSKVPAYCKCHVKRAVFTCAPKKLDTFSSFRPGQTVTKHCACHTILRVRLQAANQKSQRTVNAMQNEPRSLAHLHKPNTFSSSRPGQTVTKYCACHTILRVSLKVAKGKSQRTVNAMQNDPCSLAHLKS